MAGSVTENPSSVNAWDLAAANVLPAAVGESRLRDRVYARKFGSRLMANRKRSEPNRPAVKQPSIEVVDRGQ